MATPLTGVSADLWMTASPSIALSSPESCTDMGDHINYVASVHPCWDWNYPLTIQYSPNGSTGWTNDTSNDYTFIWPLGQIIFNTARTPGTNNFIRISVGNYFNITQLDGSFAWDNTVKCGVEKTTQFQATGSVEYNSPTLISGKVNVKTYRTDNRVDTEMEAKDLVVLQLFVDKANNIRWQGYAMIDQVQMTTNASKIMQQNPSFTWQGRPYYVTGAYYH